MFTKNWFSNFESYHTSLVVDGISYCTPEHFFQAMKTLDRAERLKIANAPTPGIAKRLGRKATIRADWEKVKIAVMYEALNHRITDPEWVAQLLATGDEDIVEWNNWHDCIWGKCTCSVHNGEGTNLLGQLLINLRSELNATST